jgi:hypothetical protein
MRPFASPSTMKSIAHSWFGRVSRADASGSRTSRLRRWSARQILYQKV